MAEQHAPHAESHGHSTAAWTGVIILLVSAAVVSVGMIFALTPVWAAGAAGIVIGLVAWAAMEKAGYGEHGKRTLAKREAAEAFYAEAERQG